ncbi:MAG TPA: DUF929 family protein [Streptosporangiaceae bacterium]|nr:DUF929 family protein [Streptosporangiaceae bacterium]
MSKAQRNRQENVRQRIAAQQAAAKRAETRRRLLLGGGAIVVVIAVVVALVVAKLGGGSSPAKNGTEPVGGTALPASVTRDVTTVPASALNAVGAGSVTQKPATSISGPALTSNGKPEMLYIGAEFCPYCAAMRWSMAVALSRFGSLSTPLKGIHSSAQDLFPNTATLTFYKTSYSSQYLTFTPVENETVDRKPLQSLTSEQNAIWAKYQPDPSTRGYPFIDIGNRYMITVNYDPKVLKDLTWSQIAASLDQPSSAVAQGVNGAANIITAAICKTTGGKPGNVCSSPGVQNAAVRL